MKFKFSFIFIFVMVLFMTVISHAVSYTADLCTDPSKASASHTGTSLLPSEAFDNIIANYNDFGHYYYESNSGSGWLEYDFQLPKKIQKYTLTSMPDSLYGSTGQVFGGNLRSWSFQGSNDNSSWITLDSQNVSSWNNRENKSFAFTNNNSYRYYRIYINSTITAGWLIHINEMEMMEMIDTTPPSIPTGLTITNITTTGFTVNWNASTDDFGVTGYNVYQGSTLIGTTTGATTCTITGLQPGTTYWVSVKAKDAAGNISNDMTVIPVTTATVYPVINSTSTSSTTNSATISGSASTTMVALAANPYRFTIGGSVSAWSTAQSFTVSGLTAGSLYNSKMEVLDTLNNIISVSKPIYTKPVLTSLQLSSVAPNSMLITISDTNDAAYTQYQIISNNKYVDQSGQLVDLPQWIALPTKTITATSLTANTSCSFQVKARNGENIETALSTAQTAVTKVGVPKNMSVTSNATATTLNWDLVDGADSYDIECDGNLAGNVNNTQFTQTNLVPGSTHTYRVRACSSSTGAGDWSTSISGTLLPNVPAGLTATVASGTTINVSWIAAAGATNYDLNLDGAIVTNVTGTSYIHTVTDSSISHTYSIRSVNVSGTSNWSSVYTSWSEIYTKRAIPAVPQNFAAYAGVSSIKISWDAVNDIDSYTLEVDGTSITVTGAPFYLHTGLSANSAHNYRIKAVNTAGSSSWSSLISQTTKASQTSNCSVNIQNGVNFNFLLKVSSVKDVSVYTYKVTYNPANMDVVDLCAATSQIDLTAGSVPDSNITITSFTPGTIILTVNKPAVSGREWTGIIDKITFKPKITGGSNLTYTIQ